MMKSITKILLLFIMLCNSSVLFAQGKPVEMADVIRSNGKIYIVVAVCLTILIGLFIYVWSVDRRVKNIEKES